MLLFIFNNLTTTTKFKNLAKSARLHSVKIIQTPSVFSEDGCSYAISSPEILKSEIFKLIGKSGIYPEAVYEINEIKKGKLSYRKIK